MRFNLSLYDSETRKMSLVNIIGYSWLAPAQRTPTNWLSKGDNNNNLMVLKLDSRICAVTCLGNADRINLIVKRDHDLTGKKKKNLNCQEKIVDLKWKHFIGFLSIPTLNFKNWYVLEVAIINWSDLVSSCSWIPHIFFPKKKKKHEKQKLPPVF